jgi:hypothetical protein
VCYVAEEGDRKVKCAVEEGSEECGKAAETLETAEKLLIVSVISAWGKD